MLKLSSTIVAASFVCLGVICPTQSFAKDPKVLDAVVATVNEYPITLFELGRKLQPPRRVSLEEARASSEIKAALDALVMEKVILAEAERRNLGVADPEIEQYLAEIAARNKMSREEFERALVKEGRSLGEYKNQVKLDILKSKVAGTLIRQSAAVSEDEVNEFLKEHQDRLEGREKAREGATRVKLGQIVVSREGRSEAETRALVNSIKDQIEDVDSFTRAAKEYSSSPEGKEGGVLGELIEKDLQPAVFEAVSLLDDGEVSNPVETPMGYHLFFLFERMEPEAKDDHNGAPAPQVDDAVRAEARQILERRKMGAKMEQYFTVEVFQQHTIDKKI